MAAKISIGILGGTGALGRGLAYRWSLAGASVTLGSRDPLKAEVAAAELNELVEAERPIMGAGLAECAASADIVVLAVPWAAHQDTLREVSAELDGKVLLDVVVPLEGGAGGLRAVRPESGSVCALAQETVPGARVVGGFHHVSYVKLQDPKAATVDCDVLLVGDDEEALLVIQQIVDLIPGMRGIFAGKLLGAFAVEALTANLISMNRRYKTNAGVRISGIK